MKRLGLLFILLLAVAPAAFAQDANRGEVGVFVDYFRQEAVDANMFGLGGRLSFNVHPNVALEGELAYDFKRNFTETFDDGVTTEFEDSNIRVLHGLFGPKFQTSGEHARVFVVTKVGFINYSFSERNPGPAFVSTIANLRDKTNRFVVFPGVGWEAYLGPVGLRMDVGDELYWNDGARHNLKVTFGPHFQF
jgi:hypothetical protein